MRLSNFKTGRRVAGFFRLCLGIIISMTLATGGMALNTACLPSAFFITPAVWVAPDPVTKCVPFAFNPSFTTSGTVCSGYHPASFVFFWPGPGIPGWVIVDNATGALWGCADNTVVPGAYTFQVGATGYNADCGPAFTADATATVTLNVIANASAPLTINPTFYPLAWENMPFTMTLSATGCSGAYNWSAVGLPSGLTVTDPVAGIISGRPDLGTCGIYTVSVTCTDTGFCPTSGCCPPVSRPYILYVDCWGGPAIPYPVSSCDFTVQIGPGLTQGQTSVMIDGIQETALAGGGSETITSIPCRSRTVLVSDTVQGLDVNTRFKVTSQNPQTVTDTYTTAYFDYAQEVLINTASDPSGVTQPPNSGFYTTGSNFISTAPSPVISDTQQSIKYIFRDWRLPDGSARTGRDLVFTVNTGGTVTAEYDTFYLLTLQSDYPYIHETQWEAKDSNATYALALQTVPIPGFWGFLGGVIRPINSSGTHLMTGPYTQVIEWNYDFTIPIIVILVILLLVIGLVVFLLVRRKRTALPADTTTSVTQTPQTVPVVATAEKKTLPEAEKAGKPNFCAKCGVAVDQDAEFCKKCGNKIT